MIPEKEYNPQEAVTVTMTRAQWENVQRWLTYGADWNHARMVWWRDCCSDRKVGAETAARYENDMIQAESLRQIIEVALAPPEPATEQWEGGITDDP